MAAKTEEQIFAEIEDRLAARFAAIPLPQVTTVVEETRNMFSESRIRDFIPLLVERRATRELSRITTDPIAA